MKIPNRFCGELSHVRSFVLSSLNVHMTCPEVWSNSRIKSIQNLAYFGVKNLVYFGVFRLIPFYEQHCVELHKKLNNGLAHLFDNCCIGCVLQKSALDKGRSASHLFCYSVVRCSFSWTAQKLLCSRERFAQVSLLSINLPHPMDHRWLSSVSRTGRI